MKKILPILLALAILFSQFAFAAKPAPTVYAQVKPADTKKSTADVYQLPGEYRKVTASLKKDTFIFITFEGSTWHKVKEVYGSTTGWMKAEDIKITTRGYSAANYGCTLGSAYTVKSSDGYAALRWGPDTYYDKIDDIPNGRYVWKYETVGNWTRVLLEDGRSGYISTSLLKKAEKIRTWPQGLFAYVQVTGDDAVYRNNYGFSSKVVGHLKSGDVIEIIDEHKSFYRFRIPATGKEGYISIDVVSPESLNKIVSTSPLFYDHPENHHTDVIWNIQPNTPVKVVASDGYISRIQYADGEGYVYDYTLKY